MADYNQKANDFNERMKKGVPKDASQKGLEEWKKKQAAMNQKKSNSEAPDAGQKTRQRGGITRD